MGSPDLFRALTRNLKGGNSRVSIAVPELTPSLAIVVAILYMMAVDGDISDRESSQLQSVVGADSDTLRRAIAYAERHEVDRFLADVPALLDTRTRICLLVNVCDSLMADGKMAPEELKLFDRLLTSLGHTRASFAAYFDIIAIKDQTSVLGDFDAATQLQQMTPPKALVVSLLYMMSADGSMAEEEIGRLHAVVGSAQGLLKESLRYVSKVRAPAFLAEAAPLLDQRQRLCVLLNTCDTMLSDHKIAGGERDLFRRMLVAFGFDAKGFDRYLNTLYLKNDLPQDDAPSSRSASRRQEAQDDAGPRRAPRQGNHGSTHVARGRGRNEGIIFERKKTWQEEGGEAGTDSRDDASATDARKLQDADASGLKSQISRTMQDNIDRMAQVFDGGLQMSELEKNARARDKRSTEKRAADGPADRRALRDGEGDVDGQSDADAKGATAPGRHGQDDAAAGKRRSMKDGEGPSSREQRDGQGAVAPGRHWQDAAAAGGASVSSADGGAAPGRHWQDDAADGDRCKMSDASGDASASNRQGDGAIGDLRKSEDTGPTQPGRHWQDAGANGDLRESADTGMTQPGRHWQDEGAIGDLRESDDQGIAQPGRHWQDATPPGQRQALEDDAAAIAGRPIVDDRKAFDAEGREDADVLLEDGPISGRMDSVSTRTRTIHGHLDSMLSAKSISAASKLPTSLMPKHPSKAPVPRTRPAITDEKNSTTQQHDALASTAASVTAATTATLQGEDMLLAADEGGPILNDTKTEAEAATHRKLRQYSAVLLPALFVTFGTTMVGETTAERSFTTSENMATDARIVHQMASVQQTVYRIAPDSVTLAMPAALTATNSGAILTAGVTSQSVAAAGSTAVALNAAPSTSATAVAAAATAVAAAAASGMPAAAEDAQSDREKADSFLEKRKQELQAMFRQHQSASAVAAERQQWFVYAKSIVLLGLGMAFWGVLFRSLRMLHGSTAAGLIGLLLTVNGYTLLLRF